MPALLLTALPADVYVASTRAYRGLADVSYPLHDLDIVVTACGRIGMHRKKIDISISRALPPRIRT